MADLIAALALVLVLEGLALAILARSIPELLAVLDAMEEGAMRRVGVVMLAAGAVIYIAVRS